MSAVLFKLNDKAGFYSVFFFVCEAYIYAKETKRDFFITATSWYYNYEHGWHDYFTSLNAWQPSFSEKYKDIKIMSHNNVPDIKYSLNTYIDTIREIYKLKPELEIRARKILETPNLTSLFVRRGDKITYGEAVFIDTKDIIRKTQLETASNIFVQTDDYRVVQELEALLPNSKIISTLAKDKFGSHAQIWKRLSPEERKLQTEEMLVGLYVCSNSNLCWTDYTSNVGRFLKLSNFDNVIFYSDVNKFPKLILDNECINPAQGFI